MSIIMQEIVNANNIIEKYVELTKEDKNAIMEVIFSINSSIIEK